MIIDCHCHAGKGDLLTGPWDTDAPLEHYLQRARTAGISKTVVFAPFHSIIDRPMPIPLGLSPNIPIVCWDLPLSMPNAIVDRFIR
jgi:hypothetical protein